MALTTNAGVRSPIPSSNEAPARAPTVAAGVLQRLAASGFESASATLSPRADTPAQVQRAPREDAVQRSESAAPRARHISRVGDEAVQRSEGDSPGTAPATAPGAATAPDAAPAAEPEFRVPASLRLGNVRAALETMRDQKRDEVDYNTARAICTRQVRLYRESALVRIPQAVSDELTAKGLLQAGDRVFVKPSDLPYAIPPRSEKKHELVVIGASGVAAHIRNTVGIVVDESKSMEELRESMRHEVNHALHVALDAQVETMYGALQSSLQSELRAHWVQGLFADEPDARMRVGRLLDYLMNHPGYEFMLRRSDLDPFCRELIAYGRPVGDTSNAGPR